MSAPQIPEAGVESPAWDRPGGLGIRERRSWKTWQLLSAVTVALLAGMAVGHAGGGSGRAAERKPLFTLPAASSTPSSPPTDSPTEEPTDDATAEPAAASTADPNAAPVILIANTNGKGSSTLPAFSTGGPWKIGWAFQCVQANGGTGRFRIFVEPEGAAPDPNAAPVVERTGRSGDAVIEQTTLGRQHLRIEADGACRWAVKVTGVQG